MNNIFFLFDRKQEPSIIEKMTDSNQVICVDNSRRNSCLTSWIDGCISVLRKSSKNDIIICWFDFQAVLCWWIAKLSFKRRNIICLNVMLKEKQTIKNKIASFMYKKALLDNRFNASVTSVEYGFTLNKRLNINKDYQLIRDVFLDTYNRLSNELINYGRTVFCGGRNGRDWDLMFKIASKMEDVTFNFVMTKDIYKRYKDNVLSNINVLYDISNSDFELILSKSALVCLPLDTEAPAGLIVMFQAAGQGKMIITSNTCTTREYVDETKGVLLRNDVDLYVSAINNYLENPQLANDKADEFLNFLKLNCNESQLVDGIFSMINPLNYESNKIY